MAGLVFSAVPAIADTGDGAELRAYARGRLAGMSGNSIDASKAYADALAAAPDQTLLRRRLLTQAIHAGDWDRALKTASSIKDAKELTGDGRILLLVDAVRRKDWARANAHADTLDGDNPFSFLVPSLKAWIAVGSKRGDPAAILAGATEPPIAAAYASDQLPLVRIALDQQPTAEQIAALSPQAKLAGAAEALRRDDKARALAMLAGDEAPVVAGRQAVEAGGQLTPYLPTAASGIGHMLVKTAIDLNSQRLRPVAISFARLATVAAPDSGQAWLALGEVLAGSELKTDAIAALRNVKPGDPFYNWAIDRRISLLVELDRKRDALAEAEAAASAPSATRADKVRLGTVLIDLDRDLEAATAFAAAKSLPAGSSGYADWTLYMMHGAALEQADRWTEARAEMQQAYKLAPSEPLVLNQLGYSQLERRENIEEAMKLVAEAHRLRPESPEITDSLGWAHFLLGDLKQAVPLLEQAAKNAPSDPEINEHLGDAYYKAGRRIEARYAWQAALLGADTKEEPRLRAKLAQGLTPQLAAP